MFTGLQTHNAILKIERKKSPSACWFKRFMHFTHTWTKITLLCEPTTKTKSLNQFTINTIYDGNITRTVYIVRIKQGWVGVLGAITLTVQWSVFVQDTEWPSDLNFFHIFFYQRTVTPIQHNKYTKQQLQNDSFHVFECFHTYRSTHRDSNAHS